MHKRSSVSRVWMCCANDSLNARMLKTTRAREATCQPWTELKPVTALLPVSHPSSAITQRAMPKFSANYDLWRRSSCERRCRKQPGTVSMITSYIFAMHDRFRRRDRSMDWSIRFAGWGINEVQKAGWALDGRKLSRWQYVQMSVNLLLRRWGHTVYTYCFTVDKYKEYTT
jgi:hypothetical protein